MSCNLILTWWQTSHFNQLQVLQVRGTCLNWEKKTHWHCWLADTELAFQAALSGAHFALKMTAESTSPKKCCKNSRNEKESFSLPQVYRTRVHLLNSFRAKVARFVCWFGCPIFFCWLTFRKLCLVLRVLDWHGFLPSFLGWVWRALGKRKKKKYFPTFRCSHELWKFNYVVVWCMLHL